MYAKIAQFLVKEFGDDVLKLVGKAGASALGQKAKQVIATEGGQIATAYAKRALASQSTRNMPKAAFTIYKRVLGTNLLRAATDERYDTGDAFVNSFDATSFIMEGILYSTAAKGATNPLKQKAMQRMGIQNGGMARRIRPYQNAYSSYLDDLVKVEDAKRIFPNLNTVTGELEQGFNMQRKFRDISRKTQLSFMRPQNARQEFAGGFIRGGRNQAVGTEIFRTLTAKPQFSRAAWGTNLVQNMDELYLPTTSAGSTFQKAYMALRSFDVLTVKKNVYGGYSRLKRNYIFQDLKAIKQIDNISPQQKIMMAGRSLGITPAKAGRLAGNHTVRQIYLRTGEDERMRGAYIEANSNKSSSVANSGAGQQQRSNGPVQVKGYYRDGFYVKPHTRSPRN